MLQASFLIKPLLFEMNLYVPFNENQDCFTFEVRGTCPEVSDEPVRGGIASLESTRHKSGSESAGREGH